MTEKYLSDGDWALVEKLMSGKPGDIGCTARDNRLFLESVLWIVRNGASWRELPPEYGKWYTSYTRFRRWTTKKVWPRIFSALAQNPSCEFFFVDGEIRWRPLRAFAPPETAHAAETPRHRAVA